MTSAVPGLQFSTQTSGGSTTFTVKHSPSGKIIYSANVPKDQVSSLAQAAVDTLGMVSWQKSAEALLNDPKVAGAVQSFGRAVGKSEGHRGFPDGTIRQWANGAHEKEGTHWSKVSMHQSKHSEPASWVADEGIWDKAKKAAAKNKNVADQYALTTYIYKAMGGKIKSKKECGKAEADSASSFPQATRAGVGGEAAINPLEPLARKPKRPKKPAVMKKPKKHKQSEIRFLVHRIREASGGAGKPGKFEVYLIEEGLGNLKDMFYYTGECIESAASVFEGKKIYADHPSAAEEEVRPERSVRDILGYFEDVQALEGEDGRMCLQGTVCLLDGSEYEWAHSLMENAVAFSEKFQDQEFVGLSINATGEAEEVDINDFVKQASIPESARVKLEKAIAEGADTIRPVSAITDAVSCDLVTEAGAGGKVLALIEQEKQMKVNKKALAAKGNKGVKESEGHEEEAEENENEDDAPPAKKVPPKKKPAPAATDDGDDDGDGDSDHPDAAQDKALVHKMLNKYFGETETDEADHEMAQKALGIAKELGYEGEEAMQAAAMHMKMLKYEAGKAAEAAEADTESETEESETEAEESEANPFEKGKNPMEAAKKMIRSLEKKNMELVGRVAALEAGAKKTELEKYMDSKLKESKLPMAITKKFRESIKGCKTKADFDEKLAAFQEGVRAGSEAAQSPLVLSVEKVVESDDGSEDGGRPSVDVSACLR